MALVAIGAIALGAYAFSPAIGGGLFTKKKATRLFYKKDEVYKKDEADSRFAPAGSSYSKSQSDARFLPSSGDIRISIHPHEWVSPEAGHSISYTEDEANFSSAGAATRSASLPLSMAVSQFGRQVRLVAVEYCFDLNGASISLVRIARSTPTPASPNPAGHALFAKDETVRTTDACLSLSPTPEPQVIGANDVVSLLVDVNYPAGGEAVAFTRATLILRP